MMKSKDFQSCDWSGKLRAYLGYCCGSFYGAITELYFLKGTLQNDYDSG